MDHRTVSAERPGGRFGALGFFEMFYLQMRLSQSRAATLILNNYLHKILMSVNLHNYLGCAKLHRP